MVKNNEHNATPAAMALRQLTLEVFRYNGAALAAGDDLTRELGLTSSLWHVLEAIGDRPLTMAQIGRVRGLTRQSVRRSVGALLDKECVEFRNNPDHKRAKLVALTPGGRSALNEVRRREAAFSNVLTKDFDAKQLNEAARILRELGDHLESR